MYHQPMRKGDDTMVKGNGKIKKAYFSIFQGDYEQAIEAFKEAIQIDPNNSSYHYKLSITYARSNKLDLAIDAAEKAHSLDPEELKYKIHLDTLHSRDNCRKAEELLLDPAQTVHAITLLKLAVRLDPINENGYLLLGLAYAKLEQYSQAIKYLQMLLKLDPEHVLGKQLLLEYKNRK
jgi:tetratricopeptide (TPR) repeat protein